MNVIRTKQPRFNPFEKINLYKPEKLFLKNDISVYNFKSEEDIVQIKFVFKAGIYGQDKPLQAFLANKLLNEGTSNYSSKKISDVIDFNGAVLSQSAEDDYASVSLLVLKKNLENIIDIFSDLIICPVFPEKFFKRQKDITLQNFVVNNEKVAVIARKKFLQSIFGDTNFYGYHTQIEDFNNINVGDVKFFHKKFYTPLNCSVFLTGKTDDKLLGLLEKAFLDKEWKNEKYIEKKLIIDESEEKKRYINKKDALQTSIKIGKVLFNRTHPDFIGMRFLSMVLGGYFGSRLMSNIREDKGYTYGIGSGIISLRNSGYFTISTEVGKNVCKNALEEIYNEIVKLQQHKIPSKELQLVKNYLQGQFLKNIDGQMNYATLYEIISAYGFGIDYLYKYYDEISEMTSERLLDLAQKYLNVETLHEITAG